MESDHDILIRVDQKVTDMHHQLLGVNGRVPEIEKEVKKHGKQINFWRGAVALAAFLIMVFGVVLWAHIGSGGR